MTKRLIISAVLFCIVLASGIFGNISANNYYRIFKEEIDSIETAYLSGENVTPKAEKLEKKWVKAEKILTAFQNRGTVDGLGRSFARLKPYANTRNDALFLCECELIRLQLLEMKQSEGITAESLL